MTIDEARQNLEAAYSSDADLGPVSRTAIRTLIAEVERLEQCRETPGHTVKSLNDEREHYRERAHKAERDLAAAEAVVEAVNGYRWALECHCGDEDRQGVPCAECVLMDAIAAYGARRG